MNVRERIAFFGQMRADFEHTGALQPSSRFLARAMSAPLRRHRLAASSSPVRILEIGPGTGAVTRAIAAAMGPADELVAYEINPEFARLLRRALAHDPILAGVADRTTIHNRAAQDLDDDAPFDFVVCSAPLNNFDAATITAILDVVLGALRPGGKATLFEYALFPALRRLLASGTSARRLRDATATKSRRLAQHGCSSVVVFRNLPPARIHELSAPLVATHREVPVNAG